MSQVKGPKISSPVIWEVDDNTYFSDFSAISNSMASKAKRSMRLYEGLFVTRTIPQGPPSPDMILGSLTHTLVCEPHTLLQRWLIACCDTRRGKIWDHAEEQAARTGKRAVPESWFEQAKCMSQAVLDFRDARLLVEASTLIEQPLRFTDRDTGLARKAKLDGAILEPAGNIAWDLKTTGSPDPTAFLHSCLEYNYHCQSCWYSEALEALTGQPARVLFVCVGKEPPFDVAINECSDKLLELGRMELRDVLARIAVAQAEGVWLSPWQRSINELAAPGWKLKEAGIN